MITLNIPKRWVPAMRTKIGKKTKEGIVEKLVDIYCPEDGYVVLTTVANNTGIRVPFDIFTETISRKILQHWDSIPS